MPKVVSYRTCDNCKYEKVNICYPPCNECNKVSYDKWESDEDLIMGYFYKGQFHAGIPSDDSYPNTIEEVVRSIKDGGKSVATIEGLGGSSKRIPHESKADSTPSRITEMGKGACSLCEDDSSYGFVVCPKCKEKFAIYWSDLK